MPRSDFQTPAQYAALGTLHMALAGERQPSLLTPNITSSANGDLQALPSGLARLGAYEAQATR